jgi:hypothetical protein
MASQNFARRTPRTVLSGIEEFWNIAGHGRFLAKRRITGQQNLIAVPIHG